MVGAEMPMTSDQVIWSEQNRLHISTTVLLLAAMAWAAPAYKPYYSTGTVSNVISVNDTVVILEPSSGAEAKGIVTATTPGAGGTLLLLHLTMQGFSCWFRIYCWSRC